MVDKKTGHADGPTREALYEIGTVDGAHGAAKEGKLGPLVHDAF
jgi:hypothetical protein